MAHRTVSTAAALCVLAVAWAGRAQVPPDRGGDHQNIPRPKAEEIRIDAGASDSSDAGTPDQHGERTEPDSAAMAPDAGPASDTPGGAPATSDGDVWGRVVVSVEVTHPPEQTLDFATEANAIDVFGIRVGDVLTGPAVRMGLRRIMLTGAWADLVAEARPTQTPSGPGVALVLRLVPDVVIDAVELRVPDELPEERLRAALGLDVGARYRAASVKAASAALRAATRELGYPRAEVMSHETVGPSGNRRLEFIVLPGAPLVLSALRFVGDAPLSDRELASLVMLRPGDAFDRPRLEAGLERLRARLRAERRLAAQVGIESIVSAADATGADVTLRVTGGPRYRVGFRGNAVFADAALSAAVGIDRVEGTGASALARAAAAVRQFYEANGYAFAKVEARDVAVPPPPGGGVPLDSSTREIAFFIAEGPRAEVAQVVIVGAHARAAAELVDEVWRTVSVESPDPGLLQQIDRGDVDDLLDGANAGVTKEKRPFEISDRGVELFPRLYIGRRPVYLERSFVEAGRRLADLYRADGFLDVNVSAPQLQVERDGKHLTVTYRVEEGQQLHVSAVRLEHTPPCAPDALCMPVLTAPAVLEGVDILPGAPVSLALVTDARARLERNLQNQGYPFARVNEGIERLPLGGDADVVFHVNAGTRVTIGKTRLRGNVTTRDLIVLDRLTLRDGDLYAVDEAERSRQRLARLGFFSSVSVDLLDADPREPVRDLLVTVKERPQFAVEVGAGVSIDDGPRGFLAGEVRNIAGFGIGVRGRGQVNYPRAFYDLIYDKNDPNNPLTRFPAESNPWIAWGRFFEGQASLTSELPKVYVIPFDTRLHVDGLLMREIRPAFTLNRGSLLGGLDAQPVPWLHLGPQLEGDISDFDCPNDLRFGQSCGEGSIGLVRRRDAGYIRQTTYRLSMSMDLRDRPVQTRSGLWASATGDLALGSGSLRVSGETSQATEVTSDFIKVSGAVAGYLPLAAGFVWANTLRGGDILPFAQSYVPLFKRFYLGGTNSIRGFREDQLLPADDAAWPATSLLPLDGESAEARNSLGGNFFVNVRSELRVAVVGDVELGLFVDAGQLLNDVSRFDVANIAVGSGVGVRYNTPVGPFALDLGWQVVDGHRRLPPLQTLDRLNLHLSIGTF